MKITAKEALKRLQDGNRRFVSNTGGDKALTSKARRDEIAPGQKPWAIVLGCSDSRVPVELVFDQGLGDLFVIRVAGNVVTPTQAGSVEFAAAHYATPLVVVLGHSMCGAVIATLGELERPTESSNPNLGSIVDCIRPSVEPLLKTRTQQSRDALIRRAVRANVRAAVGHLRSGSKVIERLVKKDGLRIVGAEYSLETGVVDFFD